MASLWQGFGGSSSGHRFRSGGPSGGTADQISVNLGVIGCTHRRENAGGAAGLW